MSILLTKGNIDDVFKVLDNHNINSALILDNKLKVLEIIKEKNVDLYLVKQARNLEEYNHWISKRGSGYYQLTPEEFELLKRWLG